MKHSEYGGLILSTGTAIDANCDIVGIAPDLDVCGGYDDYQVDKNLTQAERVELADYMIAKWQEYRKGVKMAHQNNKKCVRVFIEEEITPIRYDGVDATEVSDAGAFYSLCWHSPYRKIKIPMSRIFTVSEEYESEE